MIYFVKQSELKKAVKKYIERYEKDSNVNSEEFLQS